ncbi:CRISPR-associated endonuclease Cas2 [Desulfofustis limnaeus]|jgi:CRISPR-associated protein Cas2|uniref:CRISPR-associated endoribonuclease Cas2 n=1 Tax=Desulfofustis limnaeus TaxID=2740163 RepID=A0ABN6M9S9_9BACT|nr:CRISPR-associated endonuclease Cas2 [Desulfofustis limnaeus]MDX9896861.1 CRISPR-associated endonuclease Cas2 [Desulfofustis sp.]BDD88551.1 CRISPR-associated endoribonuclease Cas2 [Desulfofustis limnaeus]
MMVLVSYDVRTSEAGGARRLRRVAKICRNFGQRVQFSVFECMVDPAQWTMLRQALINEIDLESDSLRFYFLGANWRKRVEHVGAKKSVDQEGPLIV